MKYYFFPFSSLEIPKNLNESEMILNVWSITNELQTTLNHKAQENSTKNLDFCTIVINECEKSEKLTDSSL